MQGFFSPFPRGTSSLSVSREYLALRDGPRRFRQDFTCPALLGYAIRRYASVSVTGLSPSVVRLSRRFTYRASGSLGRLLRVIPTAPHNPEGTRVHSVWAIPLSLATTDGIADCFLFLRVLRCFTSPGSLIAAMDSPQAEAALPAPGFPIRKSTDQSLVSGSP